MGPPVALLVGLVSACSPSTPTSRLSAAPTLPAVEAPPPVAAADTDPPSPPPEPARIWRRTARDLIVHTAPEPEADRRGLILAGQSFEVLELSIAGTGCEAGWARLPAHGFACLDHTEPTEDVAVAQPALVTYDPPEPSEFEHYLATGEYDAGTPEALVPAFYAKRWRRFKGRLYADLDAWNAGAAPVARLEGGAGNKYQFTEVLQTPRGPVLLRDDGKVAAMDDVYLYPVSRMQGRDLGADPLPDGQWPGMTIDYQGAPVHVAPDGDSEVGTTLPYHTPVVLRSEPVGDGRWWAIVGGLGPGRDGFVNDWRSVRHPVLPERPAGVADDELWISVELNQQVLQLHRGDALVYWTLVSTGAAPMGTPKGIWEITDKMATRTMRSRPDADEEDAYYVEDVPWTIHWRPAYALHAAYWHWGFGRTASHGCINMAPKDVKAVWDRVGPTIPDGWHTSWATAEEPGTVLMVWREGVPVEDWRERVASR